MHAVQTGIVLGLTLAILSVTGCYDSEIATQTQESHLKTEFSEKEQQTLRNNMVAIHSNQNTEAIALIPPDFKFAKDGYFTVAVGTNSFPPLHVLAEDNQTRIGSEIDIAQLIADSLGLQLQVIPTSWENWPLGLASGKFDAVLSNIARAVMHDEKRILPVSVLLEGEYGEQGVPAGVPCVIGKNGVEEILEISLTEKEKEQLHNSCNVIRGFVEKADQM